MITESKERMSIKPQSANTKPKTPPPKPQMKKTTDPAAPTKRNACQWCGSEFCKDAACIRHGTTEPAAPAGDRPDREWYARKINECGDPADMPSGTLAGLEPVAWYLENEDEYMSEKLRKEHERLNSYTFKLCKVAHPLYSAATVERLVQELRQEKDSHLATGHTLGAKLQKLTEQLAASQAEVIRLNGVCSDYRQAQEAMFGDFAASQAREQQLREALKALQQGFPQTHQINAVIRHTLTLPQDNTALRQWGAELLNKVIPAENELGLGASYEDAAYVNGWNDCQYEVIRKAHELEAER